MNFKDKFSRASFLKGAGSAFLFLNPLLNSVLKAQAAPSAARRFIFFFTANGTVKNSWLPQGNQTPGSLSLSPILQPLNSHKNKITVLQGVHVKTPSPGDAHVRGTLSALTARKNNNGSVYTVNDSTGYNSGQSLDQFLAEQSGGSSIVAGCQSKSGFFSHVSSKGSDKPVTPVSDPFLLHKNLFSSISNNQPSQEIAYKNIMKKSVFDNVISDISRTQKKLPKNVASSLDDLMSGVRQLESSKGSGTNCAPPTLNQTNVNSSSAYPAIIDLQIKNVVTALACGLSNSAVIMCGAGVDLRSHPWVGVNEGHHSLSHKTDSSSLEKLTKINTWYAQRFNDLLNALASIPEGNGTMLDNSIVLWGNELSQGQSHSRNDIPYVIAGGAGGKLPGGRFMQFGGRDHGELLLSIAHAMGYNIQSFGDNGKQTLPGLFI